MKLDYINKFSNEKVENVWVPGLFLGGGYFQSFGRRGGVNLLLLYNLMHDNIRSPYNSPWVVRVGFSL